MIIQIICKQLYAFYRASFYRSGLSFFQAAIVSILLYGCTTWTLTKQMENKSLTAITQECYEQYWTSPGDNTPPSSSYTATNNPSRKLSKLDEPDTQDTVGEVGTSSWVMYSRGPLHMDEQRQDVQFEPTYSSSVSIRDVAWRICRKEMDDRKVWRETIRYIRADSVTWWWWWLYAFKYSNMILIMYT